MNEPTGEGSARRFPPNNPSPSLATQASGIARLSLRDKLAQLMIVRLGSDMPPKRTAEEDQERVAALLQQCPVGGLVVFNGTSAETPATLARLQRLSRTPLLVGADLERGAGQQLRPWPLVPHAMAFDALGAGAADAVFEFARLAAEAARWAGIHVTFGPVADVNSNPRNPIIATRAFSTDPGRAAELAAAFVRGCRAAGMLATAKHFPGHGDTSEDSHDAVPCVTASVDDLSARELAPFRAAIAAGAPLVMTAHVRYPALDPTGAPATFSPRIVAKLLREDLGFQGVAITDSLLMDGARMGFAGEGEMAVAALGAGVDVLLDLAEPLATLDALEAAVEAGRLPLARVDEAHQRFTALRAAAFAPSEAAAGFDAEENRRRTESLALDVARRATVVVKQRPGVLPLCPQRSLCAVLVDPFERPRNMPPSPLGDLLRTRFAKVEHFAVPADPPDALLESIGRAALGAEQLLVAFVVKPAAWYRFGLPAGLCRWMQSLAAAQPMVAACLGAPQGLQPLDAAAVQICTYSDVPASQAALVERLLAS
ncbi:MAG: hypothetical protein DCC67_08725 [Planctomycetota bacterium]|nr:MAG: hypothetical protein DCC67_08725 [Planctomycetota bacterium]